MWYAYYKADTGELVSIGTDGAVPNAGIARVDIGDDRPTGDWNTATHAFDPLPPRRILPKRDWLRRFTKAELGEVLGVDFAVVDSNIVAFVRYLAMDQDVDLDDELMTVGMTKLVHAGFLTAARATEIMGDV